MRITKGKMVLDDAFRPVLQKECVRNYPSMKNLDMPEKVVEVMNSVFGMETLAEEYVYVIALTARAYPLGFFETSHGSCLTSIVGIREIMMRVILCGAVDLIVVHNHPSGNSNPSDEDVSITKRLKDASNLLGIRLCDHIIIGRGEYFSFRLKELL